jgi:hypothetical protein
MLKLTSIISISFLFINSCFSQDSTSSNFDSYRIGLTQSSRTVTKGGFLLEGGISMNHRSFFYNSKKHSTSLFSLPRLKLGYGITKNLEVFVAQNSFRGFSKYGNESYNYGSDIFAIGAKLNLTKQKGMLPEMAVIFTERFEPSNWRENKYQSSLNLAWSYDLGKRFNLSGNIGYSFINPESHGLSTLSLKLTYKLSSKVGLFTEWYLGENAFEFYVFNIGAYYQVTPRLLLNANIGTNSFLTSYPGKRGYGFIATLGVSFLLNNPNKAIKKR